MKVTKRVSPESLHTDQSAQLLTNGMAEYSYERESLTLAEILRNLFAYADKHNLDITYYPGNVEPGYDDTPVLAANWNTPGEYEIKHGLAERRNRQAKIGKWLEWRESNYDDLQLQWSDEWTSCDNCGKAVRTSPNSYSWTRSFVELDGEIICRECWDSLIEDIITLYASNYHNGFENKALPPEFSALLESAGFTCWQPNENECKRYETGFHAHQTDDPKAVFDEIMSDSHDWEICFVILSTGQFDVDWTAYVRKIGGDN